MQEIKCPKCGEVFQIDEAGYAEIIKQVRTKEFDAEIRKREEAFASEKKSAVEIALSKAEGEKEKLAGQLKAQMAQVQNQLNAEKEQLVNQLKMELSQVQNQLETVKSQNEAQKQLALSQKEQEITRLKGELDKEKAKAQLDIKTAVQEKDNQILQLKNNLQLESAQNQLKEKTLNEKFASELAIKDEQIAYYKDFKARESTKQIGEDLEQFCLTEFNKNRALGFQNAYFEKDNAVSKASGSKGDFIFREKSSDGVEFISIMFEMKNQMDETASKHKNEDFFKELDKDRTEKNCEYAVLVSMLEEDNDYYNTGIVDVSYKYPKMYVIRPQFFISMITILRNAALNSLDYQRQIAEIKNQNVDITNFESDLNLFKDKFLNNVNLAMRQHTSAIEEIDKAIKTLEKIKDLFEKSDNNLRLANNKLDDLTVKKLVKNNPTMKEKFDELGKAGQIENS